MTMRSTLHTLTILVTLLAICNGCGGGSYVDWKLLIVSPCEMRYKVNALSMPIPRNRGRLPIIDRLTHGR